MSGREPSRAAGKECPGESAAPTACVNDAQLPADEEQGPDWDGDQDARAVSESIRAGDTEVGQPRSDGGETGRAPTRIAAAPVPNASPDSARKVISSAAAGLRWVPIRLAMAATAERTISAAITMRRGQPRREIRRASAQLARATSGGTARGTKRGRRPVLPGFGSTSAASGAA